MKTCNAAPHQHPRRPEERSDVRTLPFLPRRDARRKIQDTRFKIQDARFKIQAT